MKQLEKEMNVTSQRNMIKRYQMYGATVSKLTEFGMGLSIQTGFLPRDFPFTITSTSSAFE